MTALAKTLVMALYGEISPGEMALVRGEGLVRAAYSSARPGLALPFPCCQYLAAHDAARDAGFDAAAQSASTALPPFAVAPPPSPVHSRHPVAVASAAHLDTAAALAVAALAALAPCRSCRSRPHTFLPGSSELRDQIRVRVIAGSWQAPSFALWPFCGASPTLLHAPTLSLFLR